MDEYRNVTRTGWDRLRTLLVNSLSATALLLIFFSIGLIIYWMGEAAPLVVRGEHFFHRGDMVPVSELSPGEEIHVYRDYEILTDRPATIRRWFEDGIIQRLPDFLTMSVPRRVTSSFKIMTPKGLQPGEVILRVQRITNVNPIRTAVIQHLPDLTFMLLEPRPTIPTPLQ